VKRGLEFRTEKVYQGVQYLSLESLMVNYS